MGSELIIQSRETPYRWQLLSVSRKSSICWYCTKVILDKRSLAFNSAHMNLYRSGRDHLSWHTDEDVPLYGTSPCIASVSFGAQRKFVMRKMLGEPYAESWVPTVPSQMVAYNLSSGSLLVMRGSTQQHWEHSVMKAAELSTGPRINITFRKVIKP